MVDEALRGAGELAFEERLVKACGDALEAESKLKGESRSIRMEDFLSWGQFFT